MYDVEVFVHQAFISPDLKEDMRQWIIDNDLSEDVSGTQQMAALRLVAQFPELVPVDWSAQCAVSCTCPMWQFAIDTKCSPQVMKVS